MIVFQKITNENHPSIPTLCQWLMDWWGRDEGFSESKMQSYMMHSLYENRIPQTYVMMEDDVPIGMYQFSMMDIDVRPDIYPWLINVYIAEQFRGQGLFHTMMKSIFKNACELNLEELFLFTKHRGLYENFGWEPVEEFETFLNQGSIQRLYRYGFR